LDKWLELTPRLAPTGVVYDAAAEREAELDVWPERKADADE
jgi:hypothetical protein